MNKIIFLLLISITARSQQLYMRISAGVNSNKVFTTNLGVSIALHNVIGEANIICSGFTGQREPCLFGGRIGYKIWLFTPLIGRYYGYVSADKKTLNYWCNMYGLRIEKGVLFAEYDKGKQSIFLIGLKFK